MASPSQLLCCVFCFLPALWGIDGYVNFINSRWMLNPTCRTLSATGICALGGLVTCLCSILQIQ
ncbi:hypothetical protein FLA_0766 [Filimonas lacunae]|nr:hypothetical protein FLA_0766 [Filimonas lacunae]